MSETVYGKKYEATKNLSRVEIAKLIRADIKAAVKVGRLPKAKYYVNTSSYSGGGSIDIRFARVEEPGFVLFNPERVRFDLETNYREFTRLPIFSERTVAICAELKAISDAYNYDGSDLMTDYFHVRFYGNAEPCHDWQNEVRKVEEAAVRVSMEAPKPATVPAPPAQLSYLAALGVE